MMNILELNFEKGWRGGERQTLYAMQGLKKAGISVHLVCRKNSYLERYAKKEEFNTYSFNTVLGVMFYLITKGKNYDFIHAQTSHILTYCVLSKPFFNAPILFTRRVDFIQKGILTKLKYRFTDKIIAVSGAIKDILIRFCGRNDIEIISDVGVKNEPNTIKAKEMIDSLSIENKHIVATTSALTGHKDPFTTVKAIKKLLAKRNDFVFLHFGTGELKEAVLDDIKRNDLQKTYLLMGFVENVENFFPLFEVFVMTSKEEGLGSSVLDAFLNKIPVVSTNAGGLKELLSQDRGIICSIEDSDAIAMGIDFLLQPSVEKEKYIENSFRYANNFHNLKFITDKYIDLMKNYAATTSRKHASLIQ
jgi:glycosyltransferase involved in cell wall biosynthesis